MITDKEQIAKCRTPQLGYIAAHQDALKRIANGEKQVFCKTCKKWKWPDELCDIAIIRK